MNSRSTLAIVGLSGLVLLLAVALGISLGLNWALATHESVAAVPASIRAEPVARAQEAEIQQARELSEPRIVVEEDDTRTPNLERVAGLKGDFVSGQWPSGTMMFAAQQRRVRDNEWVLDGTWTAWHSNGEREELGRYASGAEDGPWLWWYDNGEQQAEGQFDHGRRIGSWRFWHPSGAKLAEGSYENGERSGAWRFWTADGKLHTEYSGVYRHGERVAALVR